MTDSDMKIMLNNRAEIIEGDVFSISQILVIKSFKFRMLVVRLNDRLIKKEEYETTLVKDGDDLKIIHLVSGG
jgi:sulfur carrier protein